MKLPVFIAIAALVMPLWAGAQDITTEVVVERTIVPVERAATRPAALVPVLQMPQVSPAELSTAGYSLLSPITRSFTRLQPVQGVALPSESPYRGYISAGYFPTYNLGIAAGYRAISSEREVLNLHVAFNGLSYKDFKGAERDNSYNGATLGADYCRLVGDHSRFDASLDYTFATSATWLRDAQMRNAGRMLAAWTSAGGSLDYSAYARVAVDALGHFDFDALDMPEGTFGQQRYTLGGDVALPLGGGSNAGVAAEGDFLHTAPFAADKSTLGIINLRPFFNILTGSINARIGLNVDFYTGGGSSVHISPAVDLAWTPAGILTIDVAAKGGSDFNTAADALAFSPMVAVTQAYGRSTTPVDLSAAIVVGPASGFSARLYGGYAKVDGLLVPGIRNTLGQLATADVKGWQGGLRLAYSHKAFDLSIDAATASSDAPAGHYYYAWRDCARSVIKAEGAVRPVKGLQLGVSYEFRGHRQNVAGESLGCASELSARADYRISDAIDVFADVENILGRRYTLVPGITSQPVHGLVGLTFKF
ncbi:MAG: DUF481 domain-containing protein [Muribaculaceae bacterium]|nr:DUF481 domain-containing protein [Muribaculaceae bacterium]